MVLSVKSFLMLRRVMVLLDVLGGVEMLRVWVMVV